MHFAILLRSSLYAHINLTYIFLCCKNYKKKESAKEKKVETKCLHFQIVCDEKNAEVHGAQCKMHNYTRKAKKEKKK